MEFKSAKLTLKSLTEQGHFEGELSVYGVEDLQGDVVSPKAFKRSLDHRTAKLGAAKFPLLDQHDPKKEMGCLLLEEQERGLHVIDGMLYISDDAQKDLGIAREAYKLMLHKYEAGMPIEMSIGYETKRDHYDKSIRYIDEAVLWEGSIVTFAANPFATITAVKERPAMDKPGTAQHKAQTFAQVLQSRDIMEQRYDIDCAFWRSLWSVLEDENMTAEQKIAMTQVSLQQFSEALMTWVRLAVNMSDGEAVEYMSAGRYAPQLASLVAEAKVAFAKHDTKAGAVFSARNRSTIQSCVDQLQALLALVAAQDEDSAKSHSTPPATKDALATDDPPAPEVALHAEDADEDLSEADMAQLLASIQSMGSTA
jgi:HK97 family phage prohead protease